MKKFACAIALVAGLAVPVLAAPQETVTFTNVGSFNRFSVAGNTILTATFTGTYNVARISVAGTLTPTVANDYAREATIQATSPTGQKFIINPFTSAAMTGPTVVPAGAYTQLATAEAAAGTWTFEFFEQYDDNAGDLVTPDATWTSITLTLDDATVAAPLAPIPTSPSITWTNIASNVGFNVTPATAGVSWTQLSFTVPPDQTQIVDTVVFSGQATAVAANAALNAANQITASPTSYMLVRVKPPWSTDRFTGRAAIITNGTTSASSTGVVTFSPVGLASLSTPSGTATNNPPYQGAPIAQITGPAAGTWVVEVQQNFASATLGPAFTGFWQSLSMSLTSATPPALTEPGFTLLDGGTVTKTGTFTTVGEKRWYKFTVPAGTTISRTNVNGLDIGMYGTTLAPQNDVAMAVYTSGGTLLATNFAQGPESLPHFSWGAGIRNPEGLTSDLDPGVPFDGSNPGAAPPNNFRADLTAGDYYCLLTNGDDGTIFRAGLFNADATTETNTGAYSLKFRSWLTANTAPFDVPPTTDLGTLAGAAPAAQTAAMTVTKAFKWYKFAITSDANDTTGKYVDIDTANTGGNLNDTNIALYSSAGALLSSNDDIAAGWTAANPTGGNSAMSFGMGSTTRDYTAVNTNMPAGDGRDGNLTTGTYYLQVSPCCANYQANRFWVVNDFVTNPFAGDIPVHINHNYPQTQCSVADVGVQGGSAGHDNLLDNNDFVVFIQFFFDNNPIADVGQQGGIAGADTLFDNNDFVVFIQFFFNDGPNCIGNP